MMPEGPNCTAVSTEYRTTAHGMMTARARRWHVTIVPSCTSPCYGLGLRMRVGCRLLWTRPRRQRAEPQKQKPSAETPRCCAVRSAGPMHELAVPHIWSTETGTGSRHVC